MMKNEFEMIELGELSYTPSLEFSKTNVDILLHQKRYVGEILRIKNN